MKTILVTAIAGDIGQGAATIIRETYPEWRIIGIDMKERHGGHLFVDVLRQAPAASDPSFGNWLTSLIKTEAVDFCLPLSEAELGYFLEQKINSLAGANIIMPGFKALAIGADKLETARFLKSIDVPVPWTVTSHGDISDTDLPCVYKPRRGAGSKSIFICEQKEICAFYAKHHPGGVFQELLLPADQEVTCAVYRTKSGEIAVLQMLRELIDGSTGWARVIEEPEIAAQCSGLAEALDLRGAINVQLRITSEGPRIFEINARFSSTTLMRHRMGFSDLIWALNEEDGQAVTLRVPAIGTIGLRIQTAAVVEAAID